VPVGNDGETLVADSSTTTGLRYQADFAAGKNKIINGDFSINQRGFTSTTTTSVFTFDRWLTTAAGGTSTYSAQIFTPGAAPVSGYESTNFIRIASTGQSAASDNTRFRSRIEDVRSFAGQTITLSFWAKAGTGTPAVAAYFAQVFGSGGSGAVTVDGQKRAITTSWARYSITLAIPSISGKTVGSSSYLELLLFTSAGSDFNSRTDSLGIQTATIDIWGVQIESGSTATAFQTATGTIQGELAACQRYFYRWNTGELGAASFYQATALYPSLNFPVETRIAPTAITVSSSSAIVVYVAGAARTSNSITFNTANTRSLSLALILSTGATAGQAGQMTLTGTIDASAEL
jgi:hypothetical protein